MRTKQLTEREKECLRLLLKPMRAKEIAQATGLSVNTVNEYLKSARRKLGATDSLSAANALREIEEPPNNSNTNKSGSRLEMVVSNNTSTDMSAIEPAVVKRSSLPFAAKGRPWNDQGLGWRLAWPFLLFGVIAIGAGAIMAVASELSQLTIALTR